MAEGTGQVGGILWIGFLVENMAAKEEGMGLVMLMGTIAALVPGRRCRSPWRVVDRLPSRRSCIP